MAHSGEADPATAISRAAAACAAAMAGGSFDGRSPAFDAAITPLLEAIRESDACFAFDRDGRPGAIEAVRQALPAVERDLFDAVIEDHACEVAALQEALGQIARCGTGSGPRTVAAKQDPDAGASGDR